MQNLGDRIKTLRERKGYSQTEFSEILGVSRQSVSKWENNETTPDAFNLKSIANTFKISLDELLEIKPRGQLFKAKPIHKTLSTLSIILFIATMLAVGTTILITILSMRNGLSVDTPKGSFEIITPTISTFVSLILVVGFVIALVIPIIMMILYRKGLDKTGVPLDSLLIFTIIMTFTNPLVGVIHIISLSILFYDKRKYSTQ